MSRAKITEIYPFLKSRYFRNSFAAALRVFWLLKTTPIFLYAGTPEKVPMRIIPRFISIPQSSIFPLVFLGFINTGLGCLLYFSSISALPVKTVAVCGYIEPLSAVLMSCIFLHETLTPFQAAGAFLIVGGAVFAELKKK